MSDKHHGHGHDPHDPPPHEPPAPPAPPVPPAPPTPAEEPPHHEPPPDLPPQRLECPGSTLVMWRGCRVGVYVSGEDAALMASGVNDPRLRALLEAASSPDIDWSTVVRLRPWPEVSK